MDPRCGEYAGGRPEVTGSPRGSLRFARMSRPWTGHLTIGEGWALFVGASGDNEAHAHHALQLGISAGSPLSVTSHTGPPTRACAVAIAARRPHKVQVDAGRLGLLFLDPDGDQGRALARLLEPSGLASASGPAVEALRSAIEAVDLQEFKAAGARAIAASIVSLWLPNQTEGGAREDARPAVDPRVVAARLLAREKLSSGRVRVAALAESAGLSPSRFAAIFRRDTGVPLRAFVLWARVQRAVEVVAAGHSFTDAALMAGFADAAHLSRTFRRMFGTTLSGGVGLLRIEVVRS